jgi:hypothetical protein
LLPSQDKLVSVEAGWEAELQDLKSSSTLSRDALDRLTTDLALVKSHLLKKETEVRPNLDKFISLDECGQGGRAP